MIAGCRDLCKAMWAYGQAANGGIYRKYIEGGVECLEMRNNYLKMSINFI